MVEYSCSDNSKVGVIVNTSILRLQLLLNIHNIKLFLTYVCPLESLIYLNAILPVSLAVMFS